MAERSLDIAAVMVSYRRDGGAETLLRTFAETIADSPHRLKLFCLRAPTPEHGAMLDEAGIDYAVFDGRSMLSPGRIRRLARELRDFDVVQTHLVGPNVIGTVAARLAGVGSVAVLHNARTKADDHWYHGRLESLVLSRLATRVVAVGPLTAESRQRFLPGVTIHVLSNSVGPGPVVDGETRERLRAGFMTDPQRRLVLNVGRLEEQKNQHNLIRAVPAVIAEIDDVELAIAGQGPLESELVALVDELGLADRVHVLGSRSDARELMAAADLFALPSNWEGLPVALLEAIMADTPILATAVGDVPSVIDDRSGWLVDDQSSESVAKAMVEALTTPEPETAARVAAARATVEERFGAEQWAADMLDHLTAAADQETAG